MKTIKAFSLIELMISLITISCIVAAFTPVVTKKLKNSNVSIIGNNVSDITTDCSDKFSSNCKLCTKSYCIQCELSTCSTGTYAESKSCSCKNCSDIFSNCSECDSTKCTKCKDNNYYINNGKCETCPTNKICDGINAYDESYCTNPPAGYFCDGNNIKSCREKYSMYCSKCNTTACLACDSKYYLSDGTCKPCSHAACRVCTNATYCTECDQTWIYDSTNHTCSTVCTTYLPNCTYCSSASKCTQCNGGYYLNSSNQCSPCSDISNCVYCTNSTTCSQCELGYYVNQSGKCLACTIANCTQCGIDGLCSTCNPGYYLSEDRKSCSQNDNKFNCSDSNFMRIGNLCVTRKNMGDSSTLAIPSTVTVAEAPSEYCYSQSNKCCWKGTTSVDCDSSNGGYSGCKRTVCNYSAAHEICSKFNYAGKTWRLPTSAEMENWINYSRKLGSNGLMLCDQKDTNGINTKCNQMSSVCLGGYGNTCYAQYVVGQNNFIYNLFSSWWHGTSTASAYTPVSVRCVTEME